MTSLLLRCGCAVPFTDGKAPTCPTHGVQVVVRVQGMPKPTFRGTVHGPRAKPEDLSPFMGRIAGSES